MWYILFYQALLLLQADAKWVEDKAHELDKIVSNAQIFSREVSSKQIFVFVIISIYFRTLSV